MRKDANHGHFKRDSLLYKTWTMFVLGSLVFDPIITGKTSAFEFLAVNMPKLVAASFGYFVSIMATKALGIDGTYFGIELGKVQADYKFVNSFPYNVFPHPMILGQVFALSMLGLMSHMCDGVTTPIWYLPLHMVLYLSKFELICAPVENASYFCHLTFSPLFSFIYSSYDTRNL